MHNHDDCDHALILSEVKGAIASSVDRDNLQELLLKMNLVGSAMKLKYREAKNLIEHMTPVIDEIDRLHAQATARCKELDDAAKSDLDTARDRFLSGIKTAPEGEQAA